MARIVGVNLPVNKRAEVALTYIYGIGRTLARTILTQAQVSAETRVRDLKDEEVRRIAEIIQQEGRVEGDLRKKHQTDVRRLIDIGAWRGLRHRRSLPVRGQRTRTNARTRKGPRRRIMGRKRT